MPGIPKRLNEKKVACMAVPLAGLLDKETTFFEDVLMLSPATVMVVNAEGIRKRSYWEPDATARIQLKKDADYFEAFQELFFKAVKARVRSAFPITALLSGGLDSSAIVAAAARILKNRGKHLTTPSAVFPEDYPGPLHDEPEYIELFREWDNIEMEYVTDPWRGPFDNLERLVWGGDSPRYTSRHYHYTAFGEAAGRKQSRVMLDGVGGELGPSFHGDGYLAELFLGGHWEALAEEVRGKATRANISPWRVLMAQVFKPLIPGRVLNRLGYGRYDLAQSQASHPLRQAFVNRLLVAELPRLRAASQALGMPFPHHRKNQCRAIMLSRGKNNNGFTGYERMTRVLPFYDKRLLDFCLALPGSVKVRNGYNRYVIRAGMETILPPTIQWRTTKEPFSPDFHLRYNRQKNYVLALLSGIGETDPIRAIVDVDKMEKMASHEMRGNRGSIPADFAAMHMLPSGLFLIFFLCQFERYK